MSFFSKQLLAVMISRNDSSVVSAYHHCKQSFWKKKFILRIKTVVHYRCFSCNVKFNCVIVDELADVVAWLREPASECVCVVCDGVFQRTCRTCCCHTAVSLCRSLSSLSSSSSAAAAVARQFTFISSCSQPASSALIRSNDYLRYTFADRPPQQHST